MRILFLGNSHLSAIKLAYDRPENTIGGAAMFYCAPGADLYYTAIENGRMFAADKSSYQAEQFDAFVPEAAHYYHTNRRSLLSVAHQFQITGGTEAIELADVRAIFYVAGISPYDFVRNGEPVDMALSRPLRRELLSNTLDKTFLLREHILAIRRQVPECAHYFIGSPLLSTGGSASSGMRALIEGERAVIQGMADGFLFDQVFMPGTELLDETLTGTSPQFVRGGREESEVYQGVEPTASDNIHMNRHYGAIVLQSFVAPIVDRLSLE